MNTFYKRVGENIKKNREAIGASQIMVAEICGLKSATAISLIESGKRKVSLEQLSKIAYAHNKTVDDYIKDNTIDCTICADTKIMICNGRNKKCVFCED